MGSYGYVPSCHVPKDTTSRGPEWAMLICCGHPPGMLDRGARVNVPGQRERREGKQVVKSHLLALIVGWRSNGVDRSRL
jgi:hypothetical protein